MPQRLSDVPLADLVPESRSWSNGRGIDLASWIGCVGSMEHAVAYGELFWPEFIEFDGCVFFADRFDEANYLQWIKSTGGDKRAVEAVINHVHVLDLFAGCEPAEEQVVYLGRLLREVWETKLRRDYPGKNITVQFREEECEALLDYEVTVYLDHDAEEK